ncbi:octopamine receptor beta-2R-like [Oculina patagonica]
MEAWFWILGWLLAILTMTGNGFIVFLVCRTRKLRTKTNAFVVSLAVADFCMGMSSVPSQFFCEMSSGCNSQGLLADGIDFIRWLFAYASVANLCSLVLDRYMAVVKPLQYLTFMKRSRVVQIISISWATPVTFVVLVSSLWLSLKKPIINTISGWVCMFFELLSFVVIIFCFASMSFVVWKHDRSTRTLAKQLRFNQHVLGKTQEKAAVKMMAVVIALFLVSYGIALRCSFVYILSDNTPCNDNQFKVPLLVLNSAVNPLAYAIFKRDIKKELKRWFHFVILKTV